MSTKMDPIFQYVSINSFYKKFIFSLCRRIPMRVNFKRKNIQSSHRAPPDNFLSKLHQLKFASSRQRFSTRIIRFALKIM